MSSVAEKKVPVERIEGLDQYVRDQVQAVLRETAQPFLEDMEEIRKSPAGVLIRLEEQVEGLRSEMEQRFEAVDQRFDGLRSEMEQRFDGLRVEMEQRFTDLRTDMNQRFVELRQSLAQQLTTFKWAFALIFPLLFAILGKLLLM